MIAQTQRGSTLVISMIMLVVLMLLGVMSMTTSDTAYKLAGNLQFENNALNNAEAALSDVENSLKNGAIDINHARFSTLLPMSDATIGFYPKGANIDPYSSMTWSDAYSDSSPDDDSDSSPDDNTQRRIVQLMSTDTVQIGENYVSGIPQSTACNKMNTYVITARGTSARDSTKLVRSYYSVLTAC